MHIGVNILPMMVWGSLLRKLGKPTLEGCLESVRGFVVKGVYFSLATIATNGGEVSVIN